jgi:hypothetical protein
MPTPTQSKLLDRFAAATREAVTLGSQPPERHAEIIKAESDTRAALEAELDRGFPLTAIDRLDLRYFLKNAADFPTMKRDADRFYDLFSRED